MKKQIFKVGGCVRDMLMGIQPSDIDYVAVGYTERDFAHLKKVGLSFPVFLDKNGNEIALARLERKIKSGHGGFKTEIEAVTLEEDLARRDFCFNAIALADDGEIIDFHGGQKDIKNKVIRHINPASFIEDPLRVLRLARFKTKFPDFRIDIRTTQLVKGMRKELLCLHKDRVWKEVEKVLELDNSHIFFETLLDLGVLHIIFPNLYALTQLKEDSKHHREESVFIHSMMVMQQLGKCDKILKLTALFHDIAKPQAYKLSEGKHCGGHDKREMFEPLIDIKIPKNLKQGMIFLIENHIKVYQISQMRPKKIATFLKQFKRDKSFFERLFIFADADANGRLSDTNKSIIPYIKLTKAFDEIIKYTPKEWIKQQPCSLSGESIRQHIHRHNIEVVKKYFCNIS